LRRKYNEKRIEAKEIIQAAIKRVRKVWRWRECCIKGDYIYIAVYSFEVFHQGFQIG
jgi:hypothetical protein